MENIQVVVIGTSLGGLQALQKLFSSLDESLPAAYFVVQHASPEHKSSLDYLLGRCTPMPVCSVLEEKAVRAGHVYVADSDKHLVLDEGRVSSVYGPRHNSSRPSVDVLFRSAALAYGYRVIGIILTGLLNDGANSLKDIRDRQGETIVQDPREAEYDEMPKSALMTEQVDYVARVAEMPSLLKLLCRRLIKPEVIHPPSEELTKKVELARSHVMEELDKERQMSRKNDGITHTDSKQAIINSLWSLLRLMQERSNMLENMAAGEYIKECDELARRYQEKALETHMDTLNLRKLLREYEIVEKNQKSPTDA